MAARCSLSPRTMFRLRLEGILPTCASISFGILFLLVLFFGVSSISEEPAASTTPGLDAMRYRPVILVTFGWNALYFCFLQGQHAAAFWVHKIRREEACKKDDPTSPRARGSKPLNFADVKYGKDRSSAGLVFTMDRTVGNMLEQSLPFLLAVWLNALVASPAFAAGWGWVWLTLRALYPIGFAHPSMTPALWGAQRRLGISWVTFLTWPSYAIVWSLLIQTLRACYFFGR